MSRHLVHVLKYTNYVRLRLALVVEGLLHTMKSIAANGSAEVRKVLPETAMHWLERNCNWGQPRTALQGQGG